MHGDERVAAVLGGELATDIENHLHRRRVRRIHQDRFLRQARPLLGAHLPGWLAMGIQLAAAEDIRPAVSLPLLDVVQFLELLIVAEPVDAVVHSEQFTGDRAPIEPDGIAQTRGEDRSRFSIGRHPKYGRTLRRGLVAGVTGAADGDVKLLVRPDANRAVRMLTAIRQIVDDADHVGKGPI